MIFSNVFKTEKIPPPVKIFYRDFQIFGLQAHTCQCSWIGDFFRTFTVVFKSYFLVMSSSWMTSHTEVRSVLHSRCLFFSYFPHFLSTYLKERQLSIRIGPFPAARGTNKRAVIHYSPGISGWPLAISYPRFWIFRTVEFLCFFCSPHISPKINNLLWIFIILAYPNIYHHYSLQSSSQLKEV